MHGLTRFFINNTVAANLIMLFILFAGYFTLTNIRIEGFPKIPADTITIQTTFDGSYANQVDKQLTSKIENSLVGLDGVKSIRSISMDGLSLVTIEKNTNYKLEKLLNAVQVSVASIESLPSKAKRPVITTGGFDLPALYIQVHGAEKQTTLQTLAQKLERELLAKPEISKIKTWGIKKSRIEIEINPYILQKYDITISDIVNKINESSLFFEAGTLKTLGGKISLRADSQAYYKTDYEKIPIIQFKNGKKLLLKDIAKITETNEDDGISVRFNGADTIGMEILIARKENLLKISKVVKEVVGDFENQLTSDVKLTIWGDSSEYIQERLDLLKDNAISGLIIVTILLSLFLNVKLAFWVAMGIPISIAGTVAVMGTTWIDYSLNDITTLGMIIALGILVDDAVIVGESVFEERKRISDPKKGTLVGVQKVATATVFGVLTTVAAFVPMMVINNSFGQIMASFAGVVIFTLLFSLFESKFILPAHLSEVSLDLNSSKKNIFTFLESKWSILQKYAKNGLIYFRDKIYKKVLEYSLKNAIAIFILFIASAILGLGLIAKGKIATVFYPEIPSQVITINLEMDKLAPKNLLLEHIEKIQNTAKSINKKHADNQIKKNPIENILLIINDTVGLEIYAELSKVKDREGLVAIDILRDWQKEVGELEGVVNLSFSATDESSGGFTINLYSENKDELVLASKEINNYLGTITGVSNIRDSLQQGKQKIQLHLKEQAFSLGFTTESLATQIGNLYGGALVSEIQRDSKELRVEVKLESKSRKSIDKLMNTKIRSNNGSWHNLLSIAKLSSGYTTDTITKRNSKTINTIKAFIDKNQVSPSEIYQGLEKTVLNKLKQKYPSVTVNRGGELSEIEEMQDKLIQALIIAMLVIYVLIAIPLKSYWQPLIIMAVIPFGFIGAVMGHYLLDLPLSILSFFGMIALSGILVNDSLVLMTRYNSYKEEKKDIDEILVLTGTSRLQAIFLTTATTVAGLTPLMMETSEQAQYLIPAAVSLAFGEIFATLITLILIPVLLKIIYMMKSSEGKNY